jgi:hypothetical protein
MRRILRTLILAAFAYAAWELIKGAMAEQGHGTSPAPAPSQTPPPPAPSPAPEASPAPSPAPEAEKAPEAEQKSAAYSARNGADPSKADLYQRAQQLGIKGRSKMSKAELERAIHEAG